MNLVNCIRPMNGFVLAKWDDCRENSSLFRVIAISKDETEIQIDDFIEVSPKSQDWINIPVLKNIYRLKKADIIGVYCLVADDKKMFDEFDYDEK